MDQFPRLDEREFGDFGVGGSGVGVGFGFGFGGGGGGGGGPGIVDIPDNQLPFLRSRQDL